MSTSINSLRGHLAYSQGKIAMIITRTMTIWQDGLNHQGGYAAIYDSKSLQVLKKIGGTSSHSFGISIIADHLKPGFFLAMELGDGYPRGINHW